MNAALFGVCVLDNAVQFVFQRAMSWCFSIFMPTGKSMIFDKILPEATEFADQELFSFGAEESSVLIGQTKESASSHAPLGEPSL